MKVNVIKEAAKYFVKPATVLFPAVQPYFPKKFRGPPRYDPETCIGCTACAQICPSDAITVTEKNGKRILEVWYGKCTFCARCEEVCPTDSIKLMEIYGTPSSNKFDFMSKVEHDMVNCSICGNYFETTKHIEWVIKKVKVKMGETVSLTELKNYLSMCPECRHKVKNIPELRKLLMRVLIVKG